MFCVRESCKYHLYRDTNEECKSCIQDSNYVPQNFPKADVYSLLADVRAMVEQSVIAAKWMQWWLDNNECDCEEYHICGRTERKRELEALRESIQKVSEHLS